MINWVTFSTYPVSGGTRNYLHVRTRVQVQLFFSTNNDIEMNI
jgi:hypothetical protein